MPTDPQVRTSPALHAALALLVGVAVWLAGETIYEAARMARGVGEPSWLHRTLTTHAIALSAEPCVRDVGPGGDVAFGPLGHCEQWQDAYREAPAWSVVVRHSITGDRVPVRLALTAFHVTGAIGSLATVVALGLLGGLGGTHAATARRLRRALCGTVTVMFATGITLYLLQEDTDLGFFPHPANHESAWLRWGFMAAFGLSFLDAVYHANLHDPVPARLVAALHAISFAGGSIACAVFAWRIATIPPHAYLWSHSVELLVLCSVYPVLDLLNGWVLYRTAVHGRAYDWDAHRADNLVVFAVLASVVLFFFLGSGTTYGFDTQLGLVPRLVLDLVPVAVWLVSGRLFRFVRRVAAA